MANTKRLLKLKPKKLTLVELPDKKASRSMDKRIR